MMYLEKNIISDTKDPPISKKPSIGMSRTNLVRKVRWRKKELFF